MLKNKNVLWRFFASVKLALTTLILLAVASILGTLIKQGQAPEYYQQEYGEQLARLLARCDLTHMYGSWWFLALLSLFALNLIVCSLERLPHTWRQMRQDNLAIDPERLAKMTPGSTLKSGLSAAAAAERLQQVLARCEWKNMQRRDDADGSILLFCQRGCWTRLGVFVVHSSLLFIFAGAMIGSLYGFKAYVFLPEGRSTRTVYQQGSGDPIPLDFELRCDDFEPMTYSNQGLRGERSTLTVLGPSGAELAHKTIFVNDPLSFQDITFYKADAHPLEEYFVVIQSQALADEQAFRVPPDRDVNWPGTSIFFRVAELQRDPDGIVQRAKLLLTTGPDAAAEEIWINNRQQTTIGPPGRQFTLSIRQLYTSLLLATKDPGIGIVSFGSIQLMLGLFISFCLSHRRLWVRITPNEKKGARIHLCASSSKNLPAFSQRFQKLIDSLSRDETL
ncbi:MAG: cytochrome c biogenesis protein ResB [Desulfuromonadaceae bacterium]